MIHRLLGTILFLSLSTAAQHSHSPSGASSSPQTDEAGHHACLDQERMAIERGDGFGMAQVADHNGYPGPRHVLDLKTELQLTSMQEAAMEKLRAQMREEALGRGREVLTAEARFGEMFARSRPEAELREQSFRIASLRAELRWVHLSAHLAARRLLTPEQLAAYQRLRHGAAGSGSIP